MPWPRTGMDGMESEEDTVDMEKERGAAARERRGGGGLGCRRVDAPRGSRGAGGQRKEGQDQIDPRL